MPPSVSCPWSYCYFRLCCQLCWSRDTLANGSKAWSEPGQSVLDIYCKSGLNALYLSSVMCLHMLAVCNYSLTHTETSTPTSSESRKTTMPTNLWTTTITTPPLVTTTTITTLPQLLAKDCMQPTRPSCNKGDQWGSSPITDHFASRSGWDSPLFWTFPLNFQWCFCRFTFGAIHPCI